jgi:hypothetical protein
MSNGAMPLHPMTFLALIPPDFSLLLGKHRHPSIHSHRREFLALEAEADASDT